MADEVQEPPLLEHPFEQHLQLGRLRRRVATPVDRPPGLEPLLPRPERPDPRLHAVGGDHADVVGEQRRDLRLVGLELPVRRPDRRLLVRRVLELDHRQRQPVDEDHDVGPPLVLPLDHRELIDRQPIVVPRLVEVDHPRLRPGDRPVLSSILDRHSVDQHPMYRPVAFDERRGFDPHHFAQRIAERLGGQLRIQPLERLPQAPFQDHVAEARIRPLGSEHPERDVRPVEHAEPEPGEPAERCLFDDRLGELRAHAASQSWRNGTACSLSPNGSVCSPS